MEVQKTVTNQRNNSRSDSHPSLIATALIAGRRPAEPGQCFTQSRRRHQGELRLRSRCYALPPLRPHRDPAFNTRQICSRPDTDGEAGAHPNGVILRHWFSARLPDAPGHQRTLPSRKCMKATHRPRSVSMNGYVINGRVHAHITSALRQNHGCHLDQVPRSLLLPSSQLA